LISATVAFTLFPPKLFGILWYLLAIFCAVLTIKNWSSTSFKSAKVWFIAFTPLLVSSIASVFIHKLTISRAEVLELYLGGLLFSAGFQHLDINYRKIISGAKVAAVLGLFFACYEVFYLGLDRAGVEVNPINFGFAAGIVGVFLVVKWCGGENKKNWLREGSFTLAAIIALIFSGSRGPFLAFSVILICLLSIHASSAFKSKHINLKSKMLLAFLAVNIGLGSLLLFPRTYSEIVDPSLTSPKIRLELAKEGVKQILETPLLGIGSDQAGRFLRSLEDEVLSQFNHLHNTPLNISLELGVFGGLSFLWAIVFLIAYFYKARAWAQSNAVLNGILIILFIFIASLFNDAMSHSYARKLIAFYFSICLVLLHRSIKNPPCK